MTSKVWVMRLEICLLIVLGLWRAMRKPQVANFCLEERKNKASSLIIEYWVVQVPGTFNGTGRVGFSASRQLCVTQSVVAPTCAPEEKQVTRGAIALRVPQGMHFSP